MPPINPSTLFLGLSFGVILCFPTSIPTQYAHVSFPQALKNILPALGNEFVTDIKETSLASTFFLGDLMTTFRTINGALYLTLEPLIIVGIIYFLLTFTLSKLITVFERRMASND